MALKECYSVIYQKLKCRNEALVHMYSSIQYSNSRVKLRLFFNLVYICTVCQAGSLLLREKRKIIKNFKMISFELNNKAAPNGNSSTSQEGLQFTPPIHHHQLADALKSNALPAQMPSSLLMQQSLSLPSRVEDRSGWSLQFHVAVHPTWKENLGLANKNGIQIWNQISLRYILIDCHVIGHLFIICLSLYEKCFVPVGPMCLSISIWKKYFLSFHCFAEQLSTSFWEKSGSRFMLHQLMLC